MARLPDTKDAQAPINRHRSLFAQAERPIAAPRISVVTQASIARDTAAHRKARLIVVRVIANRAKLAPVAVGACQPATQSAGITPVPQAITVAATIGALPMALSIVATGPLAQPETSARGMASIAYCEIPLIAGIIFAAPE